MIKKCFCLLVVSLFALFSSSLKADEVASCSADSALCAFARAVVEGNRNLLSAAHELEGSMLEKHKALAAFSPEFSYAIERSKSANRDFNPTTGVEEDYSTRREGFSSSIGQRTPLGRVSYDLSQSKTEYTSAQASYFSSLYLSWQAGLLRNDARLNRLEQKMIHANYDIAMAQTDSLLLDVLLGSLQSLFNRVITARNEALRHQNLSFYKTMVEEAEIKLENGMGSELDLKQASMRYQQSETELEEVGLGLREHDRNLGARLGNLDWDQSLASFTLEPMIDSIPGDLGLDSLIKQAYESRPDYRLYESRYRLRKAAFDRARELSYPDVSARLRWGKQGRSFEKST
ncbi:MAG: TolC family protein, partial [Candidatus Rifleibacteriota bacterium]